ncbi:hypothetical protein ACJD0Z_12285 [Flavobacteriaceae bacterium M23B6Z8]
MKKKMMSFGKLKFSKTNVATFKTSEKILGGEEDSRWPNCMATEGNGPTCTNACCVSRREPSCHDNTVNQPTLTN